MWVLPRMYSPNPRAACFRARVLSPSCPAGVSFFFIFLLHRESACLSEITFALHCHLGRKAAANEGGELIWITQD